MKTKQAIKRKVSYGLRQRAWWVMRRRLKFTLLELLNIVEDGSSQDAASNLGKYCRALAKAGILKAADARRKGTSPTSNGHLEYILIINSGRKTPVWRERHQEVYDPNTDITYPLNKEAADE